MNEHELAVARLQMATYDVVVGALIGRMAVLDDQLFDRGDTEAVCEARQWCEAELVKYRGAQSALSMTMRGAVIG